GHATVLRLFAPVVLIGYEADAGAATPGVEPVGAGAVGCRGKVRSCVVDDPDIGEVIGQRDRAAFQVNDDGRIIRCFDALDVGQAVLARALGGLCRHALDAVLHIG